MNTGQLATVINRIVEASIEPVDRDNVSKWLATQIREITGVQRVVIRASRIERGQAQPKLDAQVYSGASDDVYPPPPLRVSDLTFLGKPAVLGDQTELTHRLVTGPFQSEDVTLAPGECCLLVRIRLRNGIGWFLVFDDHTLESPECVQRWTQSLATIAKTIARTVDLYDWSTPQGHRYDFYQSLVDHTPGKMLDDFRAICRAWMEVSNADWSWLLIYNALTDEFELTQFAARDPKDEAQRRVLPAARTAGTDSIAKYCGLTHQAVYTENIPDWREQHEDLEYHILTANCLVELGCRGFQCVPLLGPTQKNTDRHPPIIGAVTLHYRNPACRVIHPPIAMINMGRLTALLIRRSQNHQQQEVLLELNKKAQRYLTGTAKQPQELRKRYLDEIIELIKVRLNVFGVSIFYRRPFEDAVECLASTGLQDQEGKPVESSRLSEAAYNAGEGLTGRCYATARPIMGPKQWDITGHLGKFPELRRTTLKGDLDPILLCPIPPANEPSQPERATGVIRCVENGSPMFPGELCHFDAVELETLQFIGQQIGPVLETFARHIDRESTVSVVKHDLLSPIAMIRDTADKMQFDVSHGKSLGEYDLADLQACSRLAAYLAKQLDLGRPKGQEPSRAPTHLEGDIIARLKDMLAPYARRERGMEIAFEGFTPSRDTAGVPRLSIDRTWVERAVLNLLLNAIKYGDADTTIEITGKSGSIRDRLEQYYVVEVANYGIGIEPDEDGLIFKAGYRSPRGRARAISGVGLGLAIAREAMRLHGGDVLLLQRKNPTIFGLLFPKNLAVKRS